MNQETINFLKNEIGLVNIISQPILDFDLRPIGYNCYIKDTHNISVAGGTAEDHDTAIRICIAEGLERSIFKKLLEKEFTKKKFLLDNYPTTCGFAVGFDNEKTKLRACAEGLERWAWSQWIDYGYIMEQTKLDQDSFQLNSIGKQFLSNFDDTYCFLKKIHVQVDDNEYQFYFHVFLGVRNEGIFAGSRVSMIKNEGWNHAIMEAFRNLNNFQLYDKNPKNFVSKNNFVFNRNIYFGTNKQAALNEIFKAQKDNWPIPELLFVSSVPLPNSLSDVYMWRCLFKNFISWHIGDEKRFVY